MVDPSGEYRVCIVYSMEIRVSINVLCTYTHNNENWVMLPQRNLWTVDVLMNPFLFTTAQGKATLLPHFASYVPVVLGDHIFLCANMHSELRKIYVWSRNQISMNYVFLGKEKFLHTSVGQNTKNSGHLWLDYAELQGGFNMLELISVDSGHLTRPELWLYSTDLHEIKSKDMGMLWHH